MRIPQPKPLMVAGLVCLTASLVMTITSRTSVHNVGDAPSAGRVRAEARIGEYVGSVACKQCHAAEFGAQWVTHHALSLQLVSDPRSKEIVPPEGRIPGTPFRVRRESGQLYFDTPAADKVQVGGSAFDSVPITFSTGSGKGIVSYVTPMDSEHALIIRESWRPEVKRWYLSPRMGDVHGNEPGNLIDGADAQTCIQCHSVPTPTIGLEPTKLQRGVGCESCHGPGGAHVEAMSLKLRGNLYIDMHRGKSATQFLELCGKCHSVEPQPGDVANRMLPSGKGKGGGLAAALRASRCFDSGHSGLSCTTCHDPHRDLELDRQRYNDVCANCHGGSDRGRAEAPTRGKLCPVARTGDCVSCHMPKYYVTPDRAIPRMLTLHKIAIYRSPKS